jgi:hypothetical protein
VKEPKQVIVASHQSSRKFNQHRNSGACLI